MNGALVSVPYCVHKYVAVMSLCDIQLASYTHSVHNKHNITNVNIEDGPAIIFTDDDEIAAKMCKYAQLMYAVKYNEHAIEGICALLDHYPTVFNMVNHNDGKSFNVRARRCYLYGASPKDYKLYDAESDVIFNVDNATQVNYTELRNIFELMCATVGMEL